MANTQVELPHELRELSLQDLRGVKLEDNRIDALRLIALALGVKKPKSQRDILCKSLKACPEINKHWTLCHFKTGSSMPSIVR